MSELVQRSKSKTGCITCRIRKVKCDERKPACTRCIATGRTCDGYESNFRVFLSPSPTSTSALPSLRDVEYLARHFTIKPVPAMGVAYGTGISYETEARATLRAVSEPAVHYALASLGTLRGVFEKHAGSPYSIRPAGPEVEFGLQQYTHALRSLGVRISSNDASASKYSVLCCQLFISIELALDDFASATQHFIRGLRIMYQASRPSIGPDGRVTTGSCTDIPSVDLFVIKLFLTPCPDGLTDPFLSKSDGGNREFSTVTAAVVHANMQLAVLARSTVELVKRVSFSTELPDRGGRTVLEKLQRWREEFGLVEHSRECQLTPRARLGTLFSLFFYQVLRAVATAAQPGDDLKTVEPIFDEMLAVAHRLTQTKQEVKNGHHLGL